MVELHSSGTAEVAGEAASMVAVTCPVCGCGAVRRSRKGGKARGKGAPAGEIAFRCRECRKRFFAPVMKEVPAKHDERASEFGRRVRRSHGKGRRSRPGARYQRRFIVIGVLLMVIAAVAGYYGLQLYEGMLAEQAQAETAGS